MQTNTIERITRTALLLAVALAIQSLRLPAPYGQVITGSGINATLILAATIAGPISGLLIGMLTPWVAVVMGIMALPFMAPFIMLANASLVLVYAILYRHSRLFAGVIGSLAKYGFFLLTTNVLLGLIGKQLPPPAVAVFGITQLGTALIGTFLAFIILDTLKPYLERGGR